MKILHLTSHLNIGGVSRYVLSLSKGLREHGHEVVLASDAGELAPEADAIGLTRWTAPLHTSAEFGPWASAATRELGERLRRHPVEVMHAHTRVAQVVADRLARAARIPYVTTWHGLFRPNLGRILWPCQGERVIAISEPVRSHLVRDFQVGPERIRLIPNGVDVDYFSQAPAAAAVEAYRARWHLSRQGPVIGGVGRLASGRVKGFDLLLLATRALLPEFPTLQTVLVGDGPRASFLREKIAQLGLDGRVHLLGAAADVRLPLAIMDVFVFPSRWPEGFGLSLIEAMAAGKPVVANHVGATPDIVEHGHGGWLVPPEDPAALAEGIARMLRDPSRAAQFGQEARRRAQERFSLERMVREVEAVYHEVVHRT